MTTPTQKRQSTLLPVLGNDSQAMPQEDHAREFDATRKFRPQIYWYVTFRCNLACEHCWVESSPWVDTSRDLTTPEAMAVIGQMVDLNVGGCILSGGEVLTRKDSIDLMLALADNDITIAIETNGLCFDQRFFTEANEMQKRNRFQITVSVDGGTPETHDRMRGPGTFRRTVRGIRKLAEAGVRFNVQCVLNSSNIETIPQLYDLAKELSPQLENLGFAMLNPVGRGEGLVRQLGIGFGDLRRILYLIKSHKVGFAGGTAVKAPPAAIPPEYLGMVFGENRNVYSLVTCQFPLLGVLPDGSITVCAMSREDDSLYFGNVRDTCLKDVWSKTRMDMLRSEYLAADHLKGICGDCIWKRKCKGACRAWAYEDGGDFDSPFPLCDALDEAGEFPDAYRISRQSAFLQQSYQSLDTGCHCSV